MRASLPRKLLLVDDEEDLLFMAGLAAESTGKFVVEKARDGREGLAAAFRFRPDVAVVDSLMPKMDGFELCRRLRADSRTRRLPIVILSADEPVRTQVRALAAGADRFVRKPYDQDELMELLLSLSRTPSSGKVRARASGK
ncbi:MAG: PleD family two-component system response regulator [Elusimicrobiota bacterium]